MNQVERPPLLVVDDDEEILTILSRLLSPEYTITTQNSVRGALSLLDRGERFVSVVCDLSMPEMSGLDLLRAIKDRDEGLPVIILTGQGSLETAMETMTYGGFRYLTKPFEEDDLISAVRAASASRQIDSLRRRAIEIMDSGSWRTPRDNEVDRHFDAALETMFVVFQPIMEGNERRIFGYEALVRSVGPELTNPGLLFAAAERLGRVRDVDRQVRRLVAKDIHLAPEDATLFVNLHALDLGDDELYAQTAPLSRVAHRVVLEITERMSLETVTDLPDRLRALRQLGYRIAVDDLGAGYAGLTSFTALSPDIVKLDMSLIRDVDQDPRKRSIVASMLKVCLRDLHTRVVCEGIETISEWQVLETLGADLLQGYLFGRPTREFQTGNLFPARD